MIKGNLAIYEFFCTLREHYCTHGERSSVGRASGCGPDGRGFEPLRSPHSSTQMKEPPLKVVLQAGICK